MTLFINSDSSKGGDGKSMIATTLASYLATKKDFKVGLIDLDEQKTATSLYKRQQKMGIEPHFTPITEKDDFSRFHVVIIDHPPNLNRPPIGRFVIAPINPSQNSVSSFHKYKSTLDTNKVFVYKLLNRVRKLPDHDAVVQSTEFKNNVHLSRSIAYEKMENASKTIFHKPTRPVFGLKNARKEFETMAEYALVQYKKWKKLHVSPNNNNNKGA